MLFIIISRNAQKEVVWRRWKDFEKTVFLVAHARACCGTTAAVERLRASDERERTRADLDSRPPRTHRRRRCHPPAINAVDGDRHDTGRPVNRTESVRERAASVRPAPPSSAAIAVFRSRPRVFASRSCVRSFIVVVHSRATHVHLIRVVLWSAIRFINISRRFSCF